MRISEFARLGRSGAGPAAAGRGLPNAVALEEVSQRSMNNAAQPNIGRLGIKKAGPVSF